MAQTVYRCPAAMPIETLSAWHDRQLDSAEAERVRAHIQTCPACQSYLTDFATETRGVSQFDAPYLQDRIWRGLQQEIGQVKQRRAAPSRGVILGGLGAALAVVVLFAAIAVFALDNHGHSLTVVPTGTPKATNTVAPTATVATLNVSPSQGWVNPTALALAKNIAFAQNDPLTGYACGNATSAVDTSNPILVSITHDGGLSWTTPVAIPLIGADCAMWINPSNPQDIIASSFIQCYSGCERGGSDIYYISRDSGTTWTKIILPPSQGTTSYGIDHITWAGEDVFAYAIIATGYTSSQPFFQVAVSVAGGAFSWINVNSISGGLPGAALQFSDGGSGESYAIGSTYYVQFGDTDCVGKKSTCPISSTSDHGTTWRSFIPTGDLPDELTPAQQGGGPPFITGGDGHIIYGFSYKSSILTITNSVDNGKTWIKLSNIPSFPSSAQYPQQLTLVTPDGTFYSDAGAGAADIYMLLRNGSNWEKVATVPGLKFITISWGKDGHPIAIWARSVPYSNVFPPGVGCHAAGAA